MATDPTIVLSLDEPLLNVDQAAALLSVRPSWVRDASRAGRLPCIRVGKHMRFTRPMLEDWAAQHRNKNAETGGRFARRSGRPR